MQTHQACPTQFSSFEPACKIQRKPKLQPHLSPPGLTVVQVAQVENSQDEVGEVEILVESLDG